MGRTLTTFYPILTTFLIRMVGMGSSLCVCEVVVYAHCFFMPQRRTIQERCFIVFWLPCLQSSLGECICLVTFLSYRHTHMQLHTHTRAHTHAHAHTHTRAYTHTRTHTHTHTHVHTHTRTHMRMHTHSIMYQSFSVAT